MTRREAIAVGLWWVPLDQTCTRCVAVAEKCRAELSVSISIV